MSASCVTPGRLFSFSDDLIADLGRLTSKLGSVCDHGRTIAGFNGARQAIIPVVADPCHSRCRFGRHGYTFQVELERGDALGARRAMNGRSGIVVAEYLNLGLGARPGRHRDVALIVYRAGRSLSV